MEKKKIDRTFLISIVLLTIAGFFIFTSASLGLLAKDYSSFYSVTLKQTIGLMLGICAFFVVSKIHYKNLRKYSFYMLMFALLLNLLLFIPSLAMNHGGAARWIDLGIVTFQPSEFLKITFIIYFAAWLAKYKDKVATFKLGIAPYLVMTCILGMLLLSQSDTDTLVVIASTGMIMLFLAGGRVRNLAIVCLLFLLSITFLAYTRPYIQQRIMAFINPDIDPSGSSYQIHQSLIAVGSGGLWGRGFGQSVQKFGYLPEPIGDSIFAVQAEEFGFVGSLMLIGFFLFFLFKSMKIATRAPDSFSGLLVVGIAILVIIESFMNISSMVGLIPLSGMPLLFVSHGGTALVVILGAVGIIANVSKFQKQKQS